jgi:hypothetical protein
LIANVKETTMANKRFWFGMLVMALVFGMTVVGCDNGSGGTVDNSPFNGTWTKDDYSIVVSGSNFTFLEAGTNFSKGTFTYTGTTSGSITFRPTHVWDGSTWQSYSGPDSGDWSLSSDGNTYTVSGLNDLSVNGAWTKQ